MITILTADHHPITHWAISRLIEMEGLYEVVGKVSKAKELNRFLRQSVPDILIIEIDLPELDGISSLKIIRSEYPQTKILVYSRHPEEIYALSAIKAGAAGYLCKTASTDVLLRAIQLVARGGIFLNKEINDKINTGRNNTLSRYRKLSTREVEVLTMLSNGKRNKDIAEALDINEKTVSTYKTRLLKKLRVKNIAELINQYRLLDLKST